MHLKWWALERSDIAIVYSRTVSPSNRLTVLPPDCELVESYKLNQSEEQQ